MKRYLDIFNYFGFFKQKRKLQEEVDELKDEMLIYEFFKSNEYEIPLTLIMGTKEKITYEMADVLILLTQFIAYFDIEKKELDEAILHKLERTEERIKEGYYDKD